jgi:SSS family solute:Na+ symporter
MIATFAAIFVLSLALALLSRRGQFKRRAEDFFIASGQFSAVLFFFLAVGETYSITSVLGYPGGIYANGLSFVTWFLGYIVLAFVLGYFLNPLIWRAGRLRGAVTLPDLLGRHFDSRALEIVVALAALLFLVPLGMQQFLGLEIVLKSLGTEVSPLLLAAMAGACAFAYIAISGIRASAYVAILKDILLVLAILVIAIAATRQWNAGLDPVLASAAAERVMRPSLKGDVFAVTTILLQSAGFSMAPQICASIFTARSASAVRRAQITMPLYMLMFPLLTLVAYYGISHVSHIDTANALLPLVAGMLLPPPLVGGVLAAAALSALVVLTGICLAIGPLVTRNLVPGLGNNQQRQWSKLVMVLYLLLSIAGAATSSQLMVTINNLYYFGMTQFLPGMLGVLFLDRMRPAAIIAGIIAGDVIAFLLFQFAVPLGGVNPGLIGLTVNLAIVLAVLRWAPGETRQNA